MHLLTLVSTGYRNFTRLGFSLTHFRLRLPAMYIGLITVKPKPESTAPVTSPTYLLCASGHGEMLFVLILCVIHHHIIIPTNEDIAPPLNQGCRWCRWCQSCRCPETLAAQSASNHCVGAPEMGSSQFGKSVSSSGHSKSPLSHVDRQ